MSINAEFSGNKSIYTIFISGDFNFSMLREFKNSYAVASVAEAKVIIDFRETDMIDSSALGMLLNMQKDLNKADQEITIINSKDFVRKILTITNFEKKFTIE